MTIPEIGVIASEQPPAVVITSNRTRELHDALRRRCLYHWIDHPELGREIEIVQARLPEIPATLVHQVCAFVQQLRWLELYRVPGVGETLDWTQALNELGADGVEADTADRTLGALIKSREDLEHVRRAGLEWLIGESSRREPPDDPRIEAA